MSDHWLHLRDSAPDDEEEGAYSTGWAVSLAAVSAAVFLLWQFNV